MARISGRDTPKGRAGAGVSQFFQPPEGGCALKRPFERPCLRATQWQVWMVLYRLRVRRSKQRPFTPDGAKPSSCGSEYRATAYDDASMLVARISVLATLEGAFEKKQWRKHVGEGTGLFCFAVRRACSRQTTTLGSFRRASISRNGSRKGSLGRWCLCKFYLGRVCGPLYFHSGGDT